MSRSRRIALVLALVVSAGIWLFILLASRRPLWAVDPAALEAAYRAERSLALEQGLAVVEESSSTDASLLRSIPLEAGECVAVVARTEGRTNVDVEITLDLVVNGGPQTMVHDATCTTAAGAASISFAWARDPAYPRPQSWQYAILRGRPQRARTYARLTISPTQRDAFDAEAVRARVHALEGTTLRTAIAPAASAVALPADRAAFAAARALSGRRGLAPTIAADVVDPFAAEGDVATAPRVFGATAQERLIAVVDAGALGSCIAVVLARLDDPTTPTPVRRTSIPDRATLAVAAVDPAIARDEICPASGLFVYTVDADVGGTYEVTIATLDRPVETEVAASRFGDPITGSRASDGLTILPIPYLDATRAACGASDAPSCLTVAALARDGMERAGTPREALEPICRTSGGETCDVLAGLLDGTAEADELERRACMTGFPAACLRRGERDLQAGTDLARAYGTFQYGCAQGSTDCCTAAGTMREWELAPQGAPVPEEPG